MLLPGTTQKGATTAACAPSGCVNSCPHSHTGPLAANPTKTQAHTDAPCLQTHFVKGLKGQHCICPCAHLAWGQCQAIDPALTKSHVHGKMHRVNRSVFCCQLFPISTRPSANPTEAIIASMPQAMCMRWPQNFAQCCPTAQLSKLGHST